ncbi:16053_t:CDS:2, partial [Funneliformis geosporum]
CRKQMPVYCSNVTYLEILYYHSLLDKKIISIVHSCPDIIHLSFINSIRFSNRVLELIVGSYSNLKYLNLCDDQSGGFRGFHAQEVNDEDITETSIYNVIRSCPKLQQLNLSFCKITNITIEEIVRSCLNLKNFNLEG